MRSPPEATSAALHGILSNLNTQCNDARATQTARYPMDVSSCRFFRMTGFSTGACDSSITVGMGNQSWQWHKPTFAAGALAGCPSACAAPCGAWADPEAPPDGAAVAVDLYAQSS